MPIDDLRALIERHAGRPGPSIDGVQLSNIRTPTAPHASVAEPIFVLVAQGAKRLSLGDRSYEYGAGQYLVVSVDLPVSGNFVEPSPERPFLAFGLRLRPAAIASLLLEAAVDERSRGAAARGTRTDPTGIAVNDADEGLLDAAVRLLRLLDRPADLPVLAPLIGKEILWRLVTGAQGPVVRQIGLADSGLSRVGRSIRWIREHYAESLRIEDLARLSSMSVSSFHRHFRAVTAITPIQFQKNIRLQEARARLLERDSTVAQVGLAVGYDSASQFTREYRRYFGLPPGQDTARLHESAYHAALTSPAI
jgi:AraC-like DNA-binding protein